MSFDKSGRPITKDSGCTFEEWKRRVNAYLYAACGLEADDLPDWNYADAYDHNMKPSDAARYALKSARQF